ncbi:MAG: DNA-binding transcriptional regulator [Patescibacteria group bacterium]|nr:DNA-binding transcriptional regulator [Patescibacteria group bacterium]
MAEPKRVALLIASGMEYGRGLLRGIGAYAQAHGPWAIFHRVAMLPETLSPQFHKWRPDGVIGQFESRKVLSQVRRLKVPAIDLLVLHSSRGIPRLGVDNPAVSRMAADYFRELGFEDIAYCGFRGVHYCEARREAFVNYVQQLGYRVHVFPEATPTVSGSVFDIEAAGQFDVDRIGRWLRALPKPLALMAGTDVRARQVLEACRAFDLKVPADVAVIGVGNDEVMCNLADPPLSSVALRPEEIGRQAAALLDRMMRGEEAPNGVVEIGPLCIVSRQSTNTLAIKDPLVYEAVRYIRERYAEGASIANLVKHLGVSRSTLQRKFVEALGRSPRAELIRVQLARVEQLLRETDLPLTKIARRAGFNYVECMMKLFKRKTGKTPSEYRAERPPKR